MSSTTFSGPVTSNNGFVGDINQAAALTAEHGPGFIGTGAAPVLRRWNERGSIVTEFTFDITGLYVLGTSADEVIGLEAGGIAYLRQNVVATDGIVYKASLSCLETPTGSATITGDIDISTAASAALAKNGDGTNVRGINGGTLLIGQTVVNDAPASTANHYYYLVGADTAATTGTYTAGQFVFTTWGRAALV